MRLLYIAGPYRGPSREVIEGHIETARQLGMAAANRGWYPVIPHLNTAHFDAMLDLDDIFYLDGTLELMRRCDALLLCQGWQRSRGTLGEIAEARRLGLVVFENLESLPEPHVLDSISNTPPKLFRQDS